MLCNNVYCEHGNRIEFIGYGKMIYIISDKLIEIDGHMNDMFK